VVDRQGRVERVVLASNPARFHERMILSHIKAWTFRPAMKDGRPVRYRLRVLLSV
jgi:outer membrane biosynthesis protein TonB